jgi:hypothetical protein
LIDCTNGWIELIIPRLYPGNARTALTLEDGRYFEEITKSDETRPKVEMILKIMGPRESLSKDLSSKYQCYRVSIHVCG